jgi:hypothetical protein
MGRLKIDLAGSFGANSKTFTALTHGHANAVSEAIAWLAGTVLPDAIANDHECHNDGEAPPQGWPKRNPDGR